MLRSGRHVRTSRSVSLTNQWTEPYAAAQRLSLPDLRPFFDVCMVPRQCVESQLSCVDLLVFDIILGDNRLKAKNVALNFANQRAIMVIGGIPTSVYSKQRPNNRPGTLTAAQCKRAVRNGVHLFVGRFKRIIVGQAKTPVLNRLMSL